jgi:hypothetical protein
LSSRRIAALSLAPVGLHLETPQAALERIRAYCCDCLMPGLCLRDWSAAFAWNGHSQERAEASVTVLAERRVMAVWLPDALRTQTPEDRRYALVHELCHAHLCEAEAAFDSMKRVLPPSMLDPVEAMHKRGVEHAVHAISRIAAPRLPTLEEFEAQIAGRTQ